LFDDNVNDDDDQTGGENLARLFFVFTPPLPLPSKGRGVAMTITMTMTITITMTMTVSKPRRG
jgi:hypothetical protein